MSLFSHLTVIFSHLTVIFAFDRYFLAFSTSESLTQQGFQTPKKEKKKKKKRKGKVFHENSSMPSLKLDVLTSFHSVLGAVFLMMIEKQKQKKQKRL